MDLAHPSDEPFFWERTAAHGNRDGDRPGRSLTRALAFARCLGLNLNGSDHAPLVVVGSKGKGTTATHAAATLRAAALQAADGCGDAEPIGLITSPGYRSNRERIRIDGRAISAGEYAALAGRVTAAIDCLGPRPPGGGYLSPTGAFTLAGLHWLRSQGCRNCVVEAGIGGGSDESSLTQPLVVAVTGIFGEHLGLLGDTVEEIAREKAAVASSRTSLIVSLPQAPEVSAAVRARAVAVGAVFEVLDPRKAAFPGTAEGMPGPRAAALRSPLMSANAWLGITAARRYLALKAETLPGDIRLGAVLAGMVLAGRLSTHRRGAQTWVVDSAISPPGVRAALEHCRDCAGEPSTLLISVPDSKDLDACLAALPVDAPVRVVRPDAPHLAFTRSGGRGAPVPFATIDPDTLGGVVLALGTISFVGEVLDLLDVDLDSAF